MIEPSGVSLGLTIPPKSMLLNHKKFESRVNKRKSVLTEEVSLDVKKLKRKTISISSVFIPTTPEDYEHVVGESKLSTELPSSRRVINIKSGVNVASTISPADINDCISKNNRPILNSLKSKKAEPKKQKFIRKEEILSQDPFVNQVYDSNDRIVTKVSSLLFNRLKFSKYKSLKTIKAEILSMFKDNTVGIPLLNRSVMQVVHAGGKYQNQLVKKGYIKFKIESFESASSEWLKQYNSIKTEVLLTDNPGIKIGFQEVSKISDGIFYIRYLYSNSKEDNKIPKVLQNLKIEEIDEAYQELFGKSDDSETFIYNFFARLESLVPFHNTEHNNCRGLLLPYISSNEFIDMDDDKSRTGLRMDELDSPLIEVCKHRVGGRKKIAGITTPMTTLGFTGSPITPTSLNQGPALGLLHQIKFGGDKTWLISPPRFMEKIQEQVASVLQEKLLGSSHPLMQQPLKCILNHGSILLGPEFYAKHKIPYQFVTQKAGEIVMLASRAVYSGINMGINGSEQVTVVGPDFYVNYNEGQAINQCECIFGTPPKSQGIPDKTTPGPKFTLNPEEIQVLLQKSEEWAKESSSNYAHLIVPTKRKKSKKTSLRDHKCEYCGAAYATPEARDNHEERKKCNSKCKVASCKKSTKIMSFRDMQNHIKNQHSHELDLIEELEKTYSEECLARIYNRRLKEEAEKKAVQELKTAKKKSKVVTSSTSASSSMDLAASLMFNENDKENELYRKHHHHDTFSSESHYSSPMSTDNMTNINRNESMSADPTKITYQNGRYILVSDHEYNLNSISLDNNDDNQGTLSEEFSLITGVNGSELDNLCNTFGPAIDSYLDENILVFNSSDVEKILNEELCNNSNIPNT